MDGSNKRSLDGGEDVDDDDKKPAAKDLGDATAPPKRKRKSDGKPEKTNHQERWQGMYDRLVAYKARFGDTSVPNRYPEDPQLGSWVSAQRRAYKTITEGGTGSSAMTLERANKLKELDFEWEAINPNNVPWETRYKELCAFVAKYGHANVPMRWKENVQLSNWVSKQRHDFKLLQRGTSSRLTQKRMELLNNINFVWEVERGSSIAQLQRVAVVGLPNRKGSKAKKQAAKLLDLKNEEAKDQAANAGSPSSMAVATGDGGGGEMQAAVKTPTGTQQHGHAASAVASLPASGPHARPFSSIPARLGGNLPCLAGTSGNLVAGHSAGKGVQPTDDGHGAYTVPPAEGDNGGATALNNIGSLLASQFAISGAGAPGSAPPPLANAASILHNANLATGTSSVTDPNLLLWQALQSEQQPQTVILPILTLLPTNLGIGTQSSIPLATLLQALQGPNNNLQPSQANNAALAGLLGGVGVGGTASSVGVAGNGLAVGLGGGSGSFNTASSLLTAGQQQASSSVLTSASLAAALGTVNAANPSDVGGLASGTTSSLLANVLRSGNLSTADASQLASAIAASSTAQASNHPSASAFALTSALAASGTSINVGQTPATNATNPNFSYLAAPVQRDFGGSMAATSTATAAPDVRQVPAASFFSSFSQSLQLPQQQQHQASVQQQQPNVQQQQQQPNVQQQQQQQLPQPDSSSSESSDEESDA
ncbi:helicase [Seminavis robusta]|uniref:Helicase n=1 Tax=Seminavis robusta TaxID=568900 RepID=A0A9N8DXA4_9STRA|nr:helicase [Seminavis robusta]|eukprot:Sro351_g123860.1 helicase (712) ;mRNA; f:19024-22224